MAKVFDCITEELQEFIASQHIFFVGSAPLSATGHVNLSPKGLECFRILSPHQVAYLDLTEKLGLKPRRSTTAFNSLMYLYVAIVIVVER